MATHKIQSSGQIHLDRKQKAPQLFCICIASLLGHVGIKLEHVTHVDPEVPLWPACWNPENHMPTVVHVYWIGTDLGADMQLIMLQL